MIKKFAAIIASLSVAACTNNNSGDGGASLSLSDLQISDSAACLEGPVEQFGRYIGDWKIEDTQLQQDGVTWTPQQGARWIFQCMGDGVAVQDFWMPNAGGYGTNLRIYDAETESWNIAWTAKNTPGFSHITAKENESGDIVMHYVSPEQNPPRRITFHPPTETGWDWTMDMSFDGGDNWTAVYKIKATPFAG